MTIPKQFVNLLGAVVIVAVLVLGVSLIAIPLYTNAQTVDASTREVTQTNDIYAIQVAQLSAANDRIDEIDADMSELNAQITPILRIDDVLELALVAAVATDATIQNITVADVEAWKPRVSAAAEQAMNLATAGDPTLPAEEEQTATGPAADDAAAESETADDTAADDSSETTAPPAEEESLQRQIPLTIEVEVDTAAQASAFMDALGRGPRLIVPTSGKYEAGTLIVTAYALMRTGD